MRCYMEKHHFEQAKIWLAGASLVANSNFGGDDKYAVAVSMAVHAILKANDALTYKFLTATANVMTTLRDCLKI